MDLKVAIGTWEVPPMQCGPAYYIDELVRRLSDFVDVTLIVPKHASIVQKERIVTKKIGSIDIPIFRVCMFAARAALLLRKLDVDLVHDNGVLGFSNFSPFIETWHHSNLSDREYLSTPSYYLTSYRELLTLRGIRKADSIIAISDTAKNELINIYSIPRSNIRIVPHGVDFDLFKPPSKKTNTHTIGNKNKICLLYVGALSPRKNVASLIYALSILKKRRDVHLLLVGDGSEKRHLQELARHLGLQALLSFVGPVSRERLVELYNSCNYLVVPSYNEGFGMTTLEALACEKPVIMTPVGISDIIKNNSLGVVADDFSPESIACSIESALDTEFKNLRMFVQENYSWSKTVEATLRVYKQTLDNRGKSEQSGE